MHLHSLNMEEYGFLPSKRMWILTGSEDAVLGHVVQFLSQVMHFSAYSAQIFGLICYL